MKPTTDEHASFIEHHILRYTHESRMHKVYNAIANSRSRIEQTKKVLARTQQKIEKNA